MQRWSYTWILSGNLWGDKDNSRLTQFYERLASHGQDGWELVSVAPLDRRPKVPGAYPDVHHVAYLRRPIEISST